MTTTYVLDTSVLLSAGQKALYAFGEDDVVIPFTVLKELEAKKSHPDLGYYARQAIKALDDLGKAGDITSGVSLGAGFGYVWIQREDNICVQGVLEDYADNDARIVSVAAHLDAGFYPKVILVSKDFALRLTAKLVGVDSQGFDLDAHDGDHIDNIDTFIVTADQIREVHATGSVRLLNEVPLNVGVILRSEENPKDTALVTAGIDFTFNKIQNTEASGLKSRSAEQALALNYLTDPSIKIVSLGGRAGTGKTTLALAAAVDAYFNNECKKIIVFRNMHAVGGEELGFLPGTEAEKMDPWTKAIYQSFESFMPTQQITKLRAAKVIEVQPLTHIRGQNLAGTYVVLDEAQNLEKSVIMTVLTRLGHGSKAAISWDVSQRDNFRVGRHDGIYTAVSRLLGDPLFAHVSLQKSERSPVADMVARKLDDFAA